MPRRGNEIEAPITPKKKKVTEECASLDVSFVDDEALPSGIIFTDVQSKKWRIGKPIGKNNFVYKISNIHKFYWVPWHPELMS